MEIEHKFLVSDSSFVDEAIRVHHIEQGYISVRPTVRVRLRDKEAFLTIKGPSDPTGLMREEWEYPIPLEEAKGLMRLCGKRLVVKDRYIVPHEGHEWEVDVFSGRHSGLILAELEVGSAHEVFSRPAWLGEEVTGDRRYYNATMALQEEGAQG